MESLNSNNLDGLFTSQLEIWPQARNNYNALSSVQKKTLTVNGFEVQVHFNAARIVSSIAKVDEKSIKERKCFLCEENRPKIQEGLLYRGESGSEYIALINPFPIFPKHLTISETRHVDQLVLGRIGDMLGLCEELGEYVIFYNGPKCGASAPDHMHFQAGNKGFLPIEYNFNSIQKSKVYKDDKVTISLLDSFVNGAFIFESHSLQELSEYFEKFYKLLPLQQNEQEPMMNIIAWKEDLTYRLIVFVRRKHRPECFFIEGDANILLSPASVDLGGVFITPLEKDFEKITASDLEMIINEVCIANADSRFLKEMINANFYRYE